MNLSLPWESPLAACRSAVVSFFPADDLTRAQKRKQEDEAKAICADCPLLILCREYSVLNEKYGVWGGMTEKERDKERGRLSLQDWREYRQDSLLSQYAPIPHQISENMKFLDSLADDVVQPAHLVSMDELSENSIDDLLEEWL